jgi:hypothetical protein
LVAFGAAISPSASRDHGTGGNKDEMRAAPALLAQSQFITPLKVKNGIQQPRSPMPSVFNVIDSSMKRTLNEVPIDQFVSGGPVTRVHNHDGRVLSQVYWSKSGIGLTVKGI